MNANKEQIFIDKFIDLKNEKSKTEELTEDIYYDFLIAIHVIENDESSKRNERILEFWRTVLWHFEEIRTSFRSQDEIAKMILLIDTIDKITKEEDKHFTYYTDFVEQNEYYYYKLHKKLKRYPLEQIRLLEELIEKLERKDVIKYTVKIADWMENWKNVILEDINWIKLKNDITDKDVEAYKEEVKKEV